MSIGKNAISFDDSEDSKFVYGNDIEYANNSIEEFANLIDSCNNQYNEEKIDKLINHYKNNATYDMWAEKVYKHIVNSI